MAKNKDLRQNGVVARRPIPKKPQKTVGTFVEQILKGDRITLSQAITMIESTNPAHQTKAQAILEKCLPHTGQSFRLGITGTPGVGKSSFIESLGLHLCNGGKKIAVLTIDPSSQKTKGSILGDKTRMHLLSAHDNAFIRPSPAGDSLGGVARKTRETLLLCEAAGYKHIIVETVGVGQSEITVHSMVDFFLLLLLPGAGDELQGIKRGVVEMANIIAINKADGDRINIAKQSRKAYFNALHLMPEPSSGWYPKAMTCSALKGTGIAEIWEQCMNYRDFTIRNGFFDNHRKEQTVFWLKERIQHELQSLMNNDLVIKSTLEDLEQSVLNHRKTAFQASKEIIALIRNENI